MKKAVKKMIAATTLLFTGMHFINQYIDTSNTPVILSKNDKVYQWKDLKINYTEKGNKTAPVLLLLHNLTPSSSKEEWYKIDKTLAQDYHIYELDLPGCGKSDKPDITYINYIFVQLISDFIKEIIREKANICAAAFSSSFSLMTARMNPDLIDKIIIINPTSINDLIRPLTTQGKIKDHVLGLPIIGTFLYNCLQSKSLIEDHYISHYYYNKKNVLPKEIDISYYNAHFNQSRGKYLFGSILANYTNINIIHALPMIKNEIYLITNGKHTSLVHEYKQYNDKIHAIYVSNCRLLPQLEIPATIAEKIKQIL